MSDYYAGDDPVDVWVETLDDAHRVTYIPGGIHSRKVRVPARMARRWQRWCEKEQLVQAEMRSAPTVVEVPDA